MHTMKWDYRVVKSVDSSGSTTYGIYQINYDENDIPKQCSAESISPVAADIESLSHTLIHMMGAFTRPVLDIAAFIPDTNPEQTIDAALNMMRN